MAETTSPDGGADTLAPTQPVPVPPPATESKETIILGEPSGDTPIRPFSFHATDEELADMKRRIAATRWPERELVDDGTQGVQLALMRPMVQ